MSYPDREGDLRLLRQDAAMTLSEHSPAIIKGEVDAGPESAAQAVSKLQEWQPVLELKAKHGSLSGSSGADMADWELLSPSRASVCGSSARSLDALDALDCEAESQDDSPRQDHHASAVAEALAQAMDTPVEPEPAADYNVDVEEDAAVSHGGAPHDAPALASASADTASSHASLAAADVVADACAPEGETATEQPCAEALDGQHGPASYARSDSSFEHIDHADDLHLEHADDSDATAVAEQPALAAAAAGEQPASDQPPAVEASAEEVPSEEAPVPTLPLAKQVVDDSCKGPQGEEYSATLGKLANGVAGDALTRLWLWFNNWATAVDVGLNIAVPRSGLNHYVAQAKAQLYALDWPRLTLGTGVAVLGAVVVGFAVRNHRMSRQLRQKDREVAKLVMKILSLQDTLQGTRRLPLVRHTAWAVLPQDFL